MTLRIVRLGTPRLPQEGLRIGAVRRLPRGVRKERYAADDWFDVWYPDLAPSAELVSRAQAAQTPEQWRAFVRAFRAEMNQPTPRRTLDLLAALSRHSSAATAKTNPDAIARFSASFWRSAAPRSTRNRAGNRLVLNRPWRSKLSRPDAPCSEYGPAAK